MMRAWLRWAILAGVSVALSGCFDLTQSVSIGRDGSGQYVAALSAQGIVGDAIRNKPADLMGTNRAVTATHDDNGRVTETSIADFKSLSQLAFSDQEMSLLVRGHALFGLGPVEMTFHRSFLIDRARAEHQQDNDQGGIGMRIAQSLLGDHTYVFSVTVPGSIDRIAPIAIAGTTIAPQVTGDYWHHTVTWRIPLYMLAGARALDFDVDFSAYGWFAPSSSRRV